MWLKVHVNSLFTCHVVGWRRISPNRIGGNLFPINIYSVHNLWIYIHILNFVRRVCIISSVVYTYHCQIYIYIYWDCGKSLTIQFVKTFSVGYQKLLLVLPRCSISGRKREEGEMSLRWMCIKSFMNSQWTSYQEQLSGAIMKKEGAFSTYKISKYIFSPRRSEVYIFLVSGNILFQFPSSNL